MIKKYKLIELDTFNKLILDKIYNIKVDNKKSKDYCFIVNDRAEVLYVISKYMLYNNFIEVID